MKLQQAARQAGFTLVEIAIVLVIIGLLLVGVLQGQEMIENTRVKSIVNDMKAVQAGYNAYIDRYKAIPGDELAATMTARGWTGAAGAAAANGVLAIAPATTFTTGAAEGDAFWRALRGSGLLSGDPTLTATAAMPKHAAGGMIAPAVGTNAATVMGMVGTFICASGLTAKQAGLIDVMIDGALPATNIGANIGNLRAASAAANPVAPSTAAATTAYDETSTNSWTICMKIA